MNGLVWRHLKFQEQVSEIIILIAYSLLGSNCLDKMMHAISFNNTQYLPAVVCDVSKPQDLHEPIIGVMRLEEIVA